MDSTTLKIQSELIQELEKTFGDFIQSDIGLLSDAIERYLPAIIENVLTDHTNMIIPGSIIEYSQNKSVNINNIKLQIRISESIQDPTELLLGYFPFYSNIDNDLEPVSLELDGYGKYEKFTILYPTYISLNTNFLLNCIKAIIEGCYSWFFQKMKSIIKENTILSSHIYMYIKALFPAQKDLYNSFWLIAVTNETVIYLLDEETIQHSLEQISNSGLFKSESPVKQVSELIQMKLKYVEAFVKQAATLDHSLSLNPLEGKYAGHSSLLAIGEAGIHYENATIIPILTEGKNYLFIAFPTKFCSEIEPIIITNKLVISHEFKKFQGRIEKLIKILTRQKIDLGVIGKFAGNFLGGLYKAIEIE